MNKCIQIHLFLWFIQMWIDTYKFTLLVIYMIINKEMFMFLGNKFYLTNNNYILSYYLAYLFSLGSFFFFFPVNAVYSIDPSFGGVSLSDITHFCIFDLES